MSLHCAHVAAVTLNVASYTMLQFELHPVTASEHNLHSPTVAVEVLTRVWLIVHVGAAFLKVKQYNL